MIRIGDDAAVQMVSKDQARHSRGVVGLSQSEVFSKYSRTWLDCQRRVERLMNWRGAAMESETHPDHTVVDSSMLN
jgi:hypothetical protein